MLRPEQIRIHRFTPTNKGTYKAEDVDAYMADVLASYEQMFRENGELVRKISLLADRVEAYRKDEDNIRAALLTAQRMADKIQKDANEQVRKQLDESGRIAEDTLTQTQEKAHTLLKEAKQKAENAVVTAKTEAVRIMNEVETKSREILDSANKKARSIKMESEKHVVAEKLTLERMKRETAQFKRGVLEAHRQQLELIEKIPEIIMAELDKETAEKLREEQMREASYSPAVPELPSEDTYESYLQEEPAAAAAVMARVYAPTALQAELPEEPQAEEPVIPQVQELPAAEAQLQDPADVPEPAFAEAPEQPVLEFQTQEAAQTEVFGEVYEMDEGFELASYEPLSVGQEEAAATAETAMEEVAVEEAAVAGEAAVPQEEAAIETELLPYDTTAPAEAPSQDAAVSQEADGFRLELGSMGGRQEEKPAPEPAYFKSMAGDGPAESKEADGEGRNRFSGMFRGKK